MYSIWKMHFYAVFFSLLMQNAKTYFFVLNKTFFPPSYHRIMRKGPLYMLLPIWEMQKLLNYLFYLVCSVPVNGKKNYLYAHPKKYLCTSQFMQFLLRYLMCQKETCIEILVSTLTSVTIPCSCALKYFQQKDISVLSLFICNLISFRQINASLKK